MWEPYRDVCKKYLRHCEIAVDPFHVIKHLTECFTRIRVGIMKQCVYDSPCYYLLKIWHKLLETDSFDLDNEPRYNSKFPQKMNYRDLYNMLLEISPDLKLAYELKELYRDFNKRCSFEEAGTQLDYLIELFEHSDLDCYKEFISLLKHWKPEIINSFRRPYDDRRQSNALAENINRKLRLLIEVSKGYTNLERFRARALYCLNDKLILLLDHMFIFQKTRAQKTWHIYQTNNRYIKQIKSNYISIFSKKGILVTSYDDIDILILYMIDPQLISLRILVKPTTDFA